MCGAFKSINFSCSQMPFAKKCFADAIKRFSHDRIECVFENGELGGSCIGWNRKILQMVFPNNKKANLCMRRTVEGEKLSKGLQKTFHLLAIMLLMLINCRSFLRGEDY